MPEYAVRGDRVPDHETAPMAYQVDGKHVPYGCAGVFVADCDVVCPGCASDDELASGHLVFGDDEADYPGTTCGNCGRYLDTQLLVYEGGPGSHLIGEIDGMTELYGGDA